LLLLQVPVAVVVSIVTFLAHKFCCVIWQCCFQWLGLVMLEHSAAPALFHPSSNSNKIIEDYPVDMLSLYYPVIQ